MAETPSAQEPAGHETTTDRENDLPSLDLAQPALLERLEMKRLPIDEIDWDVGDNQDWDALIADADQAFRGMSFEEAKRRGLLDDLEASQ